VSVNADVEYSSHRPMFDEFSLNAAADGLFHPASTIEAFAEHDAKYHQEIQDTSEKPRSGPRRARSGREYPPSRENHRLPALHSGKAKCDRRPASKLHPAGTNGSAPASMTATASLSRLSGGDEAKRSLSATQSDSNLYAPRRPDAVPSSADRNALDFYEHELDVDNNNNSHHSPRAESSRAVSELDNNALPDDSNSAVPPLDFSLARKFEELKKIMKSNREKLASARRSNNEEAPDEPAAHGQAPRSSQCSAGNVIRTSSSGSSGCKTEEALKMKSTLKKRSAQAARATASMDSGLSGSRHALLAHVPGTVSWKATSNGGGAIVSSIRSKREAKVRSGVSLSDLKAEHREALQMLKDLGGPVDPDYLQADVDLNGAKRLGAGRISTRAAGHPRGSGVMVSAGGLSQTKSPNQLAAASTPPTSANSSVSMVTKLRESISSGRGSPASAPAKDCDSSLPPSNSRSAEVSTGDVSAAQQGDERHGAHTFHDPEARRNSPQTSTPISDVADPWKQYQGDAVDEEDEDNNEQERDGSTEQRGGYSDEDFESDW